ncbi:Uncharacterized protein Adt_03111 [Abeliophyllum distichum]|uniref:Uncharacterized protein n=1 Tax=Abeliophyllum distichum TaxID=126358 RepID=A0ABD1W020_9LAMI
MGDLLGGEASVEEMPVPSPMTSSTNSSQFDIGLQRWARAEKEAHKIICKVQPTAVSEERRRKVIDYVQRLMRLSLGAETDLPQFDDYNKDFSKDFDLPQSDDFSKAKR